MIRTYPLIVILLFSFTFSEGKEAYKGRIRVNLEEAERLDKDIRFTFTIELDELTLSSQHMLEVTPVWMTSDSITQHYLAPVIVTGKKRHIALERAILLNGFKFGKEPDTLLIRQNGTSQSVKFTLQVPYEKWMSESIIQFEEIATGCANCLPDIPYPFQQVRLPEYKPKSFNFYVIYVIPEPEPVKLRENTYSAHINYEVNKYDLLRNYKNNAVILDQVTSIINELKSDPNLTIGQFRVTGYASPEGNFNSNRILSENRANAFLNYLDSNYDFDTAVITSEGKGEDWKGLREVVAASYMEDRDKILDIIDHTENIEARKNKLKALSGGVTYRTLLRDYYPQLRRNDYTIAYTVRAFDIEEAKKLIHTQPGLLSLNEMYLVADTYPRNSEEFKEVFTIAATLYPDEPEVKLNAAAYHIENGEFEQGLKQLEGLDTPEAWNNAGVAYARMGDMEKAIGLFKKAADTGEPNALKNYEQFVDE
ncbi:MAG: DUF3868 domain-containing protein [Tannerellaceae bacterium]|nr:DUF3868 domain-containing protein [Tannerellaceae bacterium]